MQEFKRSPSGLFLADGEVSLLRDELQVLATRALALPVAYHETVATPAELRPVVEEACQLLGAAADRLASLTTLMDQFAEATEALRASPDNPGVFSTALKVRDPGQVAGLCFLARFALMGCAGDLERLLARLTAAPDRDLVWEVVEAAQSAAREVIKAISGVDMALCAATGTSEGQPFFVTSVKESLETRHAYLTLHKSIRPSLPPTPKESRGSAAPRWRSSSCAGAPATLGCASTTGASSTASSSSSTLGFAYTSRRRRACSTVSASGKSARTSPRSCSA